MGTLHVVKPGRESTAPAELRAIADRLESGESEGGEET